MTSRITLQPAFILHSKPFSDTSLIIDFLTLDYGRISLFARGVRSSRSHMRSILQPFLPLLISWAGKTDLPVLSKAEASNLALNLSGDRLLSGFYLNELITRLLQRHDPHPQTFHSYQTTLVALETTAKPELPLRLFEKQFLADIGYGLQLAYDVADNPIAKDSYYTYVYGEGFKVNAEAELSGDLFPGSSIVAMLQGTLSTSVEFRDAKRLMRLVIAAVLGGKPLKSRELF